MQFNSNKHIAISWAIKQVTVASGFVYSDKFFGPFSALNNRNKIVTELEKKGVIAWSDTKEGAFLFKKNDRRLSIVKKNNVQIGMWIEGENVMLLPPLHAE